MNDQIFVAETLQTIDLGLVDYLTAWDKQREYHQIAVNEDKEFLILCQHPAVITLGRTAYKENILCSSEVLSHQGVAVYPVDRGGDVTLHSPGQMILYPILNLKKRGRDLKAYLFKLEQVAIDFLKEFDIVTSRFSGRTGAWFATRKIVSVGIGVKQWISFHGISINIKNDLSLYSYIRPCGLNVAMTSMQEILGNVPDWGKLKKAVSRSFFSQFLDGKTGEVRKP